MLHSIAGSISTVCDNLIVVTVSGIGWGIQVANPTAYMVGQSVNLELYMHWNAENGPSLFGFSSALEKKVFLLITSISGVGPKIGLAILGQLGPREFIQAVSAGNESALSAVSGIGPKKAEQIVFALKGKVAQLLQDGDIIGAQADGLEHWNNLTQVLKSLNYSRNEITSTLKYLSDQGLSAGLPFDQLMRQALSFLAKRA